MNASDDASEPLGESPAIDTLWAVGRGSVLGILSAADKIAATVQFAERQGLALKEIRELATHWRTIPTQPALMQAGPVCTTCLDGMTAAVKAHVEEISKIARRYGAVTCCHTCGAPLMHVSDVIRDVRPLK